jgi:hypothetical protein
VEYGAGRVTSSIDAMDTRIQEMRMLKKEGIYITAYKKRSNLG